MSVNPLPTLPQMMQWMQMSWLGLNSALPPARPASPCSKLKSTESEFTEDPASENVLTIDHVKLVSAMVEMLRSQQSAALNGVNAYLQLEPAYAKMHNAYARTAPYPVLWQEGSSALRDYTAQKTKATSGKQKKHQAIMLLIPSLINKHHIFDLSDTHSFTRYLDENGVHPMVVDWGEPGEEEVGFDCLHYITRRLCPMLEEIKQQYPDTPIFVLGYCLGGILATGLTQIKSSLVKGLVLLATPWNYEAADTPVSKLPIDMRHQFEALIKTRPTVPAGVMQQLFHWLQPSKTVEKFAYFSTLENREKIQHFLAVEHWVNDGIPLTREVAYECLLKWPQENSLMKGMWPDARQPLTPKALPLPSLCVIPEDDVIVPYHCAMGLYDQLENCTLITPELGHVGLLAAHKAPELCWQPVIKWLNNYS